MHNNLTFWLELDRHFPAHYVFGHVKQLFNSFKYAGNLNIFPRTLHLDGSIYFRVATFIRLNKILIEYLKPYGDTRSTDLISEVEFLNKFVQSIYLKS